MTLLTPAGPGCPTAATSLTEQAGAAGLHVVAASAWPESPADGVPPQLAGFVLSSFSPLAAEAATRCLTRRPASAPARRSAPPADASAPAPATPGPAGPAYGTAPADPAVPRLPAGPAEGSALTAVIVVSALGDLAAAVRVAEVVDGGGLPSPLMFFQAVPNAVAGYVAARWGLEGPVVCVGDTAAGLELAALLIEDGDADEALVVRVEQAATAAGRDRAEAVLLRAAGPRDSEGEQP